MRAITPEPFYAVGLWYDDFEQTTADEVRERLARVAHEHDVAPQQPQLTGERSGAGRAPP